MRCGCVIVDSLLEIYSVSDEPITAWPDPRLIER